jgi:hypothetical protein
MKRTQLITLLLVLFTGIGAASAKPKVAVLGLEVLDKVNIKPSIDAARQVTEGLRLAAKVSGGPLDLAENSQREFLDEKIINQCESEQRECLNKIATNFGATSLMYGKLQLSDNKKSFQVTVWLLSVDKGTTKTTSNVVPIASNAQDLQNTGRKMYGDLVGVSSQGSIAIKAKASKGIVYLNGDMKGQLIDGEYKATQLADGEYKVRITADGFKKWEDTVRVKAGQTTSVEPELEAESVKPPVLRPAREDDPEEDKGSRPSIKIKPDLESRENTISRSGGRTKWKIAAVGGVAMAAGGAYWLVTSYLDVLDANDRKAYLDREKNAEGKVVSMATFNGIDPLTFSADCSRKGAKAMVARPEDNGNITRYAEDTYIRGCRGAVGTMRGGVVLGVGSVVAIVGAYMGFIRSDATESSSATSTRRARKQRFAVTPVLSPDGGGATFRIDF